MLVVAYLLAVLLFVDCLYFFTECGKYSAIPSQQQRQPHKHRQIGTIPLGQIAVGWRKMYGEATKRLMRHAVSKPSASHESSLGPMRTLCTAHYDTIPRLDIELLYHSLITMKKVIAVDF
jgi:hypothetical protein